ncbi:MAG: hypothetical protein ACODAJ_03725 [Planctomycetota bacterium]
MALSGDTERRIAERVLAIQDDWASYRALADRKYAEKGRGAFLIDLSTPHRPQPTETEGPLYVNRLAETEDAPFDEADEGFYALADDLPEVLWAYWRSQQAADAPNPPGRV